jgi:peptide/nickel transport system substrate-binding protein
VLRVAPHADLRTLDPVFASIVITRMHGLMIYETLFAWDAALQPRPQMVEAGRSRPTTWSGPSPCAKGCASTTASP